MGSGETAEGVASASDRTGVPHCSPSASERLSKRGAPSNPIFIYRWDRRRRNAVWRWRHLSFFHCGQESLGTYVLRAAGEGRRPDAAFPLSYLQLGLGYIPGRVLVAFFMLPRHYHGEIVTAYAYLGKRFGSSTQTTGGSPS